MGSSKIRIGFRGLKRIGNHILRALYESPLRAHIKIPLIQVSSFEKKTTEDRANDLLYDPQYGKWHGHTVCFSEEGISVDGDHIPMHAATDGEAPWQKYDLDILIECTSKKSSKLNELYACIKTHAVAKKVIVTYPTENADRTCIVGVNHTEYESADRIISCGSCTTNCLAPILYTLQREETPFVPCFAHTVHAATSSQDMLETLGQIGDHATGAAKLIGTLFPALKGKMIISADRVPTPEVSKLIVGCMSADDGPSSGLLKKIFTRASKTYLSGVLDTTSLKRYDLSGRYRGNSHSAIINLESIRDVFVGGRRLATLYAWYDNEFAYSCRVRDVIGYIAEREGWVATVQSSEYDPEFIPRPAYQYEERE